MGKKRDRRRANRRGRVGCARAGQIHSSERNFLPNILSIALSILSAFFAGLSETVSVAEPRQTSFLVFASKRSTTKVPLRYVFTVVSTLGPPAAPAPAAPPGVERFELLTFLRRHVCSNRKVRLTCRCLHPTSSTQCRVDGCHDPVIDEIIAGHWIGIRRPVVGVVRREIGRRIEVGVHGLRPRNARADDKRYRRIQCSNSQHLPPPVEPHQPGCQEIRS